MFVVHEGHIGDSTIGKHCAGDFSEGLARHWVQRYIYLPKMIINMVFLSRDFFLLLGKLHTSGGCRLHHTGRLGSDGVSSSSALKPRNLRRSIGVWSMEVAGLCPFLSMQSWIEVYPLLPLFQIISHSKNLGESSHLKVWPKL